MDCFTTAWDQLDVNPVVKTCINIIVNKLVKSESVNEYDFPTSLTSSERQFVDIFCTQFGLKTTRRRNGSNRWITAYKKSSTIISLDSSYGLLDFTQNIIKALLQRFPVSDKEKKETSYSDHRLVGNNNHNQFESNPGLNCTTGRLSNIIPQIPIRPPLATGRIDETILFRKGLPVWKRRDDILEAIAANRIVVISGGTGAGKTTQIPQFILEYCNLMKKACRIICAEPRSLYAHSVAERVSHERNEVIGQTVGYQIRLESKVSPRTLLTFCTNGVLLRTLMGGENSLQSVTHLIIDEIQENDRFTEFLLLIIRELTAKYRNFKVILMSSSAHMSHYYSHYFGCCPTIEIASPNASLQYFYLEDILRMTSYISDPMKAYSNTMETKETQKQMLTEWFDEINVTQTNDYMYGSGDIGYETDMNSFAAFGTNRLMNTETLIAERDELDVKLKMRIDSYLRNAWTHGTDYAFQHLIDLMVSEHISIDYQHSVSGVTALIAAAAHNKINVIESLLSYGANIALRTPNDWNAINWSQHFGHKELTELLETYSKCIGTAAVTTDMANVYNSLELSDDQKQILDLYYHSLVDSHRVDADIDLICHLIHFIITNDSTLFAKQKDGSILVFLAGYDEIIKLREKIISDSKRFDANKYALFTLYSQMPNNDLKRVFRRIPSDVRKIILSTNISESNISIDEVVFVIDSGKVRQKVFDTSTGFSYHVFNWISKTNAVQRRSRANRLNAGICFHLYDKSRFNRFDELPTSDMNKMSVYELCLQTKLLAPNEVMISEFMMKALKPPSLETVRKSVQLLKTIDALESNEQLTQLGLHLLDLPIEPNLGKMVLYSVVLKCLDPVLTIVCSLSYHNPFVVPQNQASRRRTAFSIRKKLSAKTFSDHIILLRGFQNWQKAKHDACEKQFCEQNFISSASMEMIVNMRAQLLGQLRASGFVRARGPGDIRDLNTNSDDWAVVKAALCGGGYPYIVRVDRDRNQLITNNDVNVRFHPNSVLNTSYLSPKESVDKNRAQLLDTLPTDWLLFNGMTKTGKTCYVECCTIISPITIALFAGNIQTPIDSYLANVWKPMTSQFCDNESDSESEDKADKDKHILKIDNWMAFKLEPQIANLTLQLRQKWNSLFYRRMCSPSKPMTPSDDIIIKTIVEVLTTEEQNLGLQQPVGIGQRPRPMSTDFCPPVSNVPLYSPLNKGSLQSGRQTRVSPQTQQQQYYRNQY